MANAGQPPSIENEGPNDIPAGRPDALDRLGVLVGQWEMEASFAAGSFGPESPAITNRGGLTTFEWIEGEFFLLQRFVSGHPAAPSGVAIVGPAGDEGFVQHYFDSRGVERLYQMTLDNREWTLWRDDTVFAQRYRGRFSDDGSRIDGAWETSRDPGVWTRDFGLSYIKVP